MTKASINQRNTETQLHSQIQYNAWKEIKEGTIIFFHEDHPGYNHVCMKKIKIMHIPRIFRRKEKHMEDLSMEDSNVSNSITEIREKYVQ